MAAFGDAGHAFPAIALARALRRRGHEVLVETWEQWREAVEAEGLGFTAAEEYKTFPPPAPGSADGASAADAARALVPLMEEFRPDVVVSDVLTVAPALAAEKAGRRRATLIPHVYPVHEPGMPFFAFGMQPPRTPVGRAAWRAGLPLLTAGLRRGRREMNEMRAAVGLAPVDRLHGGISAELALVATFPQLEYPRRWPAGVRVTGPMEFELPYPEVELPEGDEPLVLVAPSTAQDPELRLLRASLEALAEEPVRVVATTNRREPDGPLPEAPANAVVVDWLSYSQVMPQAALVVCHGGHGTVCTGACRGGAGALLPGGRGHGGERGAGGVGGRGADAAVAAHGRRVRCGGRCGGSWAIRDSRLEPARSRPGRGRTTGRSGAPRWWRRSPPNHTEAGPDAGLKLRGRDSNPQPSR